jgi:membrane protein implicated in regulation of membrane protease activity
MLARIGVVLAIAGAVILLFTVRVTLPMLTLIGLIAWAALASITALVFWRRTRTTTRNELGGGNRGA